MKFLLAHTILLGLYISTLTTDVDGMSPFYFMRDLSKPSILLGLFIGYSIGSFALFMLLSTLDYWLIFEDRRNASMSQIWKEIKLNVHNCLGSSLIFVPWIYINYMTKSTAIFYDPLSIPIPTQLIYVLTFVVVSEFQIYWGHRLLHEVPYLYKNFHKPHHAFIRLDPYSAGAFDPTDAFVQGLSYFILPVIIPMQIYVSMIFLIFVIFWTVSIHDQRVMVKGDIINGAGHHIIHHTDFNYNYGQVFTIFDRLFGTYRAPRNG
ncbi:Sterol desaturase [Kaumoebavirus]|uniref:Sterol desaturase n=1 Tax=Kaumoebavirus TaxID=1859492 RepID=UPI0009C24057|nr:Sterol desaturase [Kaumoebavirus]ARA71999.1 Sterol desaturase [Kaumoebavirus]